MCYSLKSVEPSEYTPSMPWSIRQAVVYHSMDVETQKSFWIIVKGDELIKERIEDAADSPVVRKTLGGREENSNALSRSLATHMIVCDWCSTDWRWYISYLEESVQEKTGHMLAAMVHHPNQLPKEKTSKAVTWSTTASSLKEKRSLRVSRTIKSLPSRTSRIASRANSFLNNTPSTSFREKPDSLAELQAPAESPTLEPIPPKFSFTDLQRVQLIEDKANEVSLIVDSNIKVLKELREHYSAVVASGELPAELVLKSKSDLERFEKRIVSVTNDLHMQQARTQTLLRLLGDRKKLVSVIYQSCIAVCLIVYFCSYMAFSNTKILKLAKFSLRRPKSQQRTWNS